jgi:hypothetical protein
MEARSAIVLPGYGDRDEGGDSVHLSTDPKFMNQVPNPVLRVARHVVLVRIMATNSSSPE